MQSLFALLLQFSGKAWAALAVAVLCGGAVTVFYFTPAHAGSNPTAASPPAVVQAGHAGDFGPAAGGDHCGASVPVVPEANAGLVLIPVVAAMLFVSARRLWPTRRALAVEGQNAGDASEPQPGA